MTYEEKICKVLIAKGKWTIARCQLCRKIKREKCQVLEKQNMIKEKND